MTTYPFRQGIDYGPRRGTAGLAFHMSEGGDGLVDYLAKRPGETVAQWRTRVRSVSANAAILSDGTIWQMVAWDHASGSMNPADRSSFDKGYYGAEHVRSVLDGGRWKDPNAWAISVEIAGRRATGPTDAQVEAAIAWGLDMRRRFPTVRGAFGHADQTDTKGCPGTTANMRAIFDGVGGHGLFTSTDIPSEEDPMRTLPVGNLEAKLVDLPAGVQLLDLNLQPKVKASIAQSSKLSPIGLFVDGVRYRVVVIKSGDVEQLLAVRSGDVDAERPAVVVPDSTELDAMRRRLEVANGRIGSAAVSLGAARPPEV